MRMKSILPIWLCCVASVQFLIRVQSLPICRHLVLLAMASTSGTTTTTEQPPQQTGALPDPGTVSSQHVAAILSRRTCPPNAGGTRAKSITYPLIFRLGQPYSYAAGLRLDSRQLAATGSNQQQLNYAAGLAMALMSPSQGPDKR